MYCRKTSGQKKNRIRLGFRQYVILTAKKLLQKKKNSLERVNVQKELLQLMLTKKTDIVQSYQ